jgi:hypothetical protein
VFIIARAMIRGAGSAEATIVDNGEHGDDGSTPREKW